MGFLSILPDSNAKDHALQRYSNAYVVVDGKLLAHTVSLSIEKKNQATPIFTLASGFAGLSQGAPFAEVTIESAVPSADFDLAPDRAIRTNSVVEIGIVMAGNQTIFKGFIQSASYRYSVNDSAKLSMHMTCRYEDFE